MTTSLQQTGLLLVGCFIVLTCGWPPSAAHAQPLPGSIVLDQSGGDTASVISGVTDGPCTEPGPADQPMDGYNAVLSGPGVFAPNAVEGATDGIAVVSTDNAGLSGTEPVRFAFRASLAEVATELQAPLLPGEYVLTFRCVNQLGGTVHQTFTATLQLSGGPPATTFAVSDPVTAGSPATPSSTVNPAPAPEPPGSAPTYGPGPGASLIGIIGATLGLALAGIIAYLVVRHRKQKVRT